MYGLRSSLFSRVHRKILQKYRQKKEKKARHPGKNSIRTRHQGPTNRPRYISRHVLTRDFSTLIREMYHGCSRPDPHETRTSLVTRSVAGRVGLGQQAFKYRGSGRVGSGQEVLKSRGSGRVGSGREVLKSRGSGRVGSRSFTISRVGSGRVGSEGFKVSSVGSGLVNMSRKFLGSGRIS